MREAEAESIAREFLSTRGPRRLELIRCQLENRPGRRREWCVMFTDLDVGPQWDNNEVWVEIDDETAVPRLFPML